MAYDIPGELSIIVVCGAKLYSVPVRAAVLSVGRKEGADVRIPDRFVSARHAVLRFEEGTVTVEDVGSRNGVRVRNVPIEVGKPTRFRPRDVIQIGASVLMLRQDRGPWTPPPPPPLAGAPALSTPGSMSRAGAMRCR